MLFRHYLSTIPSTEMSPINGARSKETSISQGWLPDNQKDETDFSESSFFNMPGRELPSPSTISTSRGGVVTFSEIQLMNKLGPNVTIDEAVTMWAIKKRFGRQIPVPELFGWRVYQATVFIYMELIPGVTLQERWSDLNFSDKASICERLRQMISSLRQFQHESDDKFIGKPEIN